MTKHYPETTKKKDVVKSALEKAVNFEWDDTVALLSGTGKSLLRLDKKDALAILWGTPFDYVQAALKGKLKNKFYSDIQSLIDEGKLPEDFLEDDLTQKTFVDIARIIDSENPSVDKIDAMKALLIAVANPEEKKRYEIATHLNTLRELDSLEFNIIMSSYRLRKNGRADQKSPRTKSDWRGYIMEETGWDENMIYEIERRENHLVELRLLDSHPGQDTNNLPQTQNCRLTGLGIKLGDIATSQE